MGTTLAQPGAYNLAGVISTHPQSVDRTVEQYNALMRAIVDEAQKLPWGIPYLLHRETWWGIWLIYLIFGAISRSAGLIKALFKFQRPVPDEVKVGDFGFGAWESMRIDEI